MPCKLMLSKAGCKRQPSTTKLRPQRKSLAIGCPLAIASQNDMRSLLSWLRAKGVVSKTPLHTLRKQFGSEIHARYGLLAASEALRHGGVGVTARHYIENKQRSVAELTVWARLRRLAT